MIHKDWGGRLPLALVYPNTYYTGMSSLAVHALYRLFNQSRDVVCERVFHSVETRVQEEGLPLSLESQRPLADFSVIAFTVSYELDYFHVVDILRRSGIPLFAAQRDETWPLILAGGPAVSANPEPLADIIDAFAIGEAEALVAPLLEVLPEACRTARLQAWRMLAHLPGVYVPMYDNAPVRRVWQRDLDVSPATTQIYTRHTEFGDRGLIEIGRGCWRGCRFCLAGFVYRPTRHLSLEVVLSLAHTIQKYRDKVGLVSAAVSDHPQIDPMVTELRRMGLKVAVSSLRVDSLSETLVRALAESDTQTLTIAPEAGSPRLRGLINKPQDDARLLEVASLAARYNFPQLKMYFMIGHPSEVETDVEAIVDLVAAVRARFPRQIVINATPYVPKPHTPFQWAAMTPADVLAERIAYLERRLQPLRVTVRSDSPAWAEVEGALARGDRRLGTVLVNMERTSLSEWKRSLKRAGLSAAEYLRARSYEEVLPWSVVDLGVTRAFLEREMRRAQATMAQMASQEVGGCPL
ncbi:MAG: radical SAM protein [Anaerolineae bacterium]|nr:radical SAM protein [Anaerolineae bacterium]MDW8070941.1 radical SAM protein [Anaerolineae bacterium]